jgi:hypothetical protein
MRTGDLFVMMIVEYVSNRRFLDRDLLYLVERDFVIAAVVEFGRPRRFMVGDLLRHFQFTAVFQIGVTTPNVKNSTLRRTSHMCAAAKGLRALNFPCASRLVVCHV